MTDHRQSDESIRLACRSLRSSVSKMVASKAKRNIRVRDDEARRAAEHACHALTTLGDKRRSLRGALRALDGLGDDAVSALEKSAAAASALTRDGHGDDAGHHVGTTARVVLCHWMMQYLRVRDGVVLMQTGECRHPADVAAAGGGGGGGDRGRGGTGAGADAAAGEPARKRLKKKGGGATGGGGGNVAAATPFRSRFGGDRTVRGDGYTRMYSASCYSGYSLDELLDQEVGVRARLSAALAGEGEADMDVDGAAAGERRRVRERREREWSRLMDRAVLFDNELNRHEEEFKELVKELDQKRKRFVDSVNSLLARLHSSGGKVSTSSGSGGCGGGNFAMAGGDKLEKLELTNAGGLRIRLLRIQRRGGDDGGGFRVSDPGGALPSDSSVPDWRRRMRLPALLPTGPPDRGGGRAMLSSKAEEGGGEVDGLDSDFMPPSDDVIGGGLRVKTAFFAATDGRPSPVKKADVSLREIKNRLGVDGESLRASREGLEAESEEVERRGGGSGAAAVPAAAAAFRSLPSAHSSAEADCDDVPVAAELDKVQEEISRARDELARCKKALREVEGDEEQEWDARESLRESLMTLGSLLLRLQQSSKDRVDVVWHKIASFPGTPAGPIELLREAETLFKGAVKVVQMLQASQDGNTNESHDGFIKRTLLLLRGRAFVNLGISLIEQAQCGIRRTQSGRPFVEGQNGVRLLGKAVDALKSAEEAAREMRAQSEVARERAPPLSEGLAEAQIDVIQGAQLESLACRWHGTALWHLGTQKEAVAILDISTGKGEDDVPEAGQVMDGAVMEAKFHCLVERYYGAMTLRELAVTASEACVQKGRMEKEGDALVSLACRGYHRAVFVSREIYHHTDNLRNSSTAPDLVSEHQIYPEETLLSAIDDLKQWWKERKAMRQNFNPKSKKSGTSLRSIPTYLPRNDVRTSASLDAPRGPPTMTIAMKLGAHKRKKKSQRTTEREVNADEVFDSSAHHESSVPHGQCEHQQMQFRKWGDDLLPQKQMDGGGTTVFLQYPSCAPPMPPELMTGQRENG